MLNFISIISFDSLKNAVKETVRLLQVVWRLSPFMWALGKVTALPGLCLPAAPGSPLTSPPSPPCSPPS